MLFRSELQEALEWPYLFAPDQGKRVTLFSEKPDPDATGFALYVSLDGVDYDLETGAAVFHAGGTLQSATWPRYTLDRQAVIRFVTHSDAIAGFSSLSDTDWFARKMLVLVGSGLTAAIYAARQLVYLGENVYELRELYGPLGDTRATAPSAGSSLFVFRIEPLYSVAGQPAWVNGQTLTLKGIPFGSRLSPDLGGALAASLPIRDRAKRPYAPSEVLANNAGQSATYTGDIALSWGLRHRPGGLGGQVTPSPFLPDNTDCEVDDCEVDIYVANTFKRTLAATVKHGTDTTTISAVTSAIAFTVASATGLQAGTRVGIVMGGMEYFRRIKTVAGTDVVLFTPLPVAPSGGETVRAYEQAVATYTSAQNVADNGALAIQVEARVFTKLNGLRSLFSADITVLKE